jgi:hypothetical protein
MKITPTNIIDGTHVKDLIHLPLGAFKKLAREKVDPLWGIHGDELRGFKAEVQIEKIKRETHYVTVIVAAPDERTAKRLLAEKAQDEADEEFGDDFDEIDVWVGNIKEVKL